MRFVSDRIMERIGIFEVEAHTRARMIRNQTSGVRNQGTIKKHVLNAHVVMKIFDVAYRPGCTAWMSVNRGPTMRRQRQRARLAER